MTTWFTSDLHFGHKGIIELANRPFHARDAVAMDAALIELWNDKVRSTDTVYVLGDFAFGNPTRAEACFHALNGTKHLVRGNHDYHNERVVLRLPWESQSDLLKVRLNGQRFICCHYPLTTWDGAYKGYFQLHGHSHGTLTERRPRQMDVGVDALERWGIPFGTPIHAEQVVSLLGHEDYKAVDHHGL